MKISKVEQLVLLLEDKNKQITIISHINPDGDAVGSCLGFYHFLKNDKHLNVKVILPGEFPSFLAWMPGTEDILIADSDKTRAFEILQNSDILFCLDFNDPKRTGVLSEIFSSLSALKVLIDHHPNPTNQFDVAVSQLQVSSTAELIYEFIISIGKQELIDITIAQCLYAGIVTDTGSFSYACNNPRTYYITGHFMNLGLDGEKIHRQIYDNYSEDRIRLLGHCLSQNLRILPQYSTSYIFLSAADLLNFNYKEGDSEGVVNYALSIKGIRLAAIFIERTDQIKISFRSEGNLNVNILARKYFKGGGHKNASGGSYNDTLVNTLLFFEKILAEISTDDFKQLKVVQDIA